MDDWGDPWADSTAEKNTTAFELKGGHGAVLNTIEDDAGWGSWTDTGAHQWGSTNAESWKDTIVADKVAEPVFGLLPGGRLGEASDFTSEVQPTQPNDTPWHAKGVLEDTDSRAAVQAISAKTDILSVTHSASEDLTFTPSSETSSDSSGDGDSTSTVSRRTSFDDDLKLEVLPKDGKPSENFSNGVNSDLGGFVREGKPDDFGKSPEKPEASDVILERHASSEETPRPIELALVDELFGCSTVSDEFPDPARSLISSASVRKAWHKMSRQETLRGYNSGQSDGSHVRIAWLNSAVRNETIQVISKWNIPSVQSPKSPLKSSSNTFHWNSAEDALVEGQVSPVLKDIASPTSPVAPSFHNRNKSFPSASMSTTEVPTALFGWSTAAAEQSSWRDNPFDASPSIVPTLTQASNIKDGTALHRRAVTISSTSSRCVEPSEAPFSQALQVAENDDLQDRASNVAESSEYPVQNNTSGPIEEDDEDWGEMVQSSPTIEPNDNEIPADTASEVEENILSRTGSKPTLHPTITVPQRPRLPAPWFSELPQKAPVRSYLINKADLEASRTNSSRKHVRFDSISAIASEETPRLPDAILSQDTSPTTAETVKSTTAETVEAGKSHFQENVEVHLSSGNVESQQSLVPGTLVPSANIDTHLKQVHSLSTLPSPDLQDSVSPAEPVRVDAKGLAKNTLERGREPEVPITDAENAQLIFPIPDLSYMLR